VEFLLRIAVANSYEADLFMRLMTEEHPREMILHGGSRIYRREPVALYSMALIFKMGEVVQERSWKNFRMRADMQERDWDVVRDEQKGCRKDAMVGRERENSRMLAWGKPTRGVY
jgi:hypothetical protein